MSWKPKLTTIPPRDEMEPDRRLEDLKVQPDEENLANTPLVEDHPDPVQKLKEAGQAFIAAMRTGGSDRTKRLALRKVAVNVLLEVMAQNKQWWEE